MRRQNDLVSLLRRTTVLIVLGVNLCIVILISVGQCHNSTATICVFLWFITLVVMVMEEYLVQTVDRQHLNLLIGCAVLRRRTLAGTLATITIVAISLQALIIITTAAFGGIGAGELFKAVLADMALITFIVYLHDRFDVFCKRIMSDYFPDGYVEC